MEINANFKILSILSLNNCPDAHQTAPHKPAGPYDLPHGHHYPSEAYPLGMVPGRKSEGWEGITAVVLVSCFLILTVGSNIKSGGTFPEWARREALAREKHIENGGTVEFGKYYQNAEYEDGDGIDAAPVMKEK